MDTTLIKKYDKGSGISYTFGTFPTFELVQHKPDVVECVLVHSKLQVSQEIEKLFDLCKASGIEIIYNDKLIHKIVDKEIRELLSKQVDGIVYVTSHERILKKSLPEHIGMPTMLRSL